MTKQNVTDFQKMIEISKRDVKPQQIIKMSLKVILLSVLVYCSEAYYSRNMLFDVMTSTSESNSTNRKDWK